MMKSKLVLFIVMLFCVALAMLAGLSMFRTSENPLSAWEKNPTRTLSALRNQFESIMVIRWEPVRERPKRNGEVMAAVWNRKTREMIGGYDSYQHAELVKPHFAMRIANQHSARLEDVQVFVAVEERSDQLDKEFTGTVSFYSKHSNDVGEYFSGREVVTYTLFGGRVVHRSIGHVDW